MQYIESAYDALVVQENAVLQNAPDYSGHYAEYSPGQYWTADPKGKARIVFAEEGSGSARVIASRTISTVFAEAAKLKGNKITLRSEEMPPLAKGEEIPGPVPLAKWSSWTYAQYYHDCRSAAKAMISLGLQPHDAANILGFNCREWFVANMAAILAGGHSAGIYPTDNEEQIQFKVNHSNGAVMFVENKEGFEKVKTVIDDLPYLKAIVTWACDDEDVTRSDGSKVETVSFDGLLKLGETLDDDMLNLRISNQRPNECCSLIYTSGTTGQPKAVMISHDNLVYEATCVVQQLKAQMIGVQPEEERIISYLPLSHVAGMMVDIITPLIIATESDSWCSSNFARPYDLKRGSIGARLATVQPTIFLGVPRVWEKIMEKLKQVGAQTPDGITKSAAKVAKERALEAQINLQLGGSGHSRLGFPFTTVLGLVKNKLGLSKCKFAFAGAAPMTRECLEFFGAYNINVNEVYGMSECTGACTWSTDLAHTWGSVGYELSGTEVKIFKEVDGKLVECPRAKNLFEATEEEQGEICMRGRNVMMGYMCNHRLGEDHVNTIVEKNQGTIDEHGWLHSGDKGCIDVHGMLKITGRYKELIIGAGGENIAPVPIEDNLKKLMPAISNVMMVGDKRKFNVALVSLKVEGATGELPGGSQLTGDALNVSPESKTIEDAMSDPQFIEYLTKGFEATNNDGKVVVSNAAKIQKFTILPTDFSVQTGELTATLKLKRSVVADKYADAIEKLYASDQVYVNCFE